MYRVKSKAFAGTVVLTLSLFVGCNAQYPNSSHPPESGGPEHAGSVAVATTLRNDQAMPTVQFLDAGNGFVATRNDGTVWYSGYQSDDFHYGDTSVAATRPIKIADNAVGVSASSSHIFILQQDASLWAYGYNRYGQVGDGTTQTRHYPVHIMDDVVLAKAEAWSGFALKSNGDLYYWGPKSLDDFPGDDGPKIALAMQDVATFSACGYRMLAIKTDGSLWGWGEQGNGQLGVGHLAPVPIMHPQKLRDNVSAVSTSSDHTFLIDSNYRLWGCGHNAWGDIGVGHTAWEVPQFTHVLDNVEYYAVANWGYSNAAITADGKLWTWGDNRCGQLGIDMELYEKNVPTHIMDDVKKISVQGDYMAAIKSDDTLWLWGQSTGGLVEYHNESPQTPQQVMEDVHSVFTELSTIMALKNDGALWGWGWNGSGILGDGTLENCTEPVLIMDDIRLPA